MSLKEYQEKRDFGETSEPMPRESGGSGPLIYVMQKHHASHLHYDLRLEVDGILKSWAVPKGPSMNPHDKRLAVLVEDHPLDYARFEGEIPAGQYGAGRVDVWDSGSWIPLEEYRDIKKALEEGAMEFLLEGKKLKGEFRLVAMKHSTAKHGWLLIKAQDEYASDDFYDANER